MRAKPGLVLASLASVTALTIGVGTAMASGGGTCTYKLTNGPPGPSSTMSGSVKCSKPGKGKAHFSYSSTLAPSKKSLNLIYSGKFKDKFTRGTIKGTFRMKGAVLPPSGPTFTMTGKFRITRGTGKLSKAHGRGTMTCTSSDFTAHFTCTQVLTRGRL